MIYLISRATLVDGDYPAHRVRYLGDGRLSYGKARIYIYANHHLLTRESRFAGTMTLKGDMLELHEGYACRVCMPDWAHIPVPIAATKLHGAKTAASAALRRLRGISVILTLGEKAWKRHDGEEWETLPTVNNLPPGKLI